MAATVKVDATPASGRCRILAVTGDSSYGTGGYAVSSSIFSSGATVAGIDTGGTTIAQYDSVNKKVKLVTRATGAEVASLSDQSATTVKLIVYP